MKKIILVISLLLCAKNALAFFALTPLTEALEGAMRGARGANEPSNQYESAYFTQQNYQRRGGYYICYYKTSGGMSFSINSRKSCYSRVKVDIETSQVLVPN